jgi:hypothetical protein
MRKPACGRLARLAVAAYSGLSRPRGTDMPIRTASMTKKISANGQALHRAMMSRMESGGSDKQPSEAESALVEERRALKEERDKRKAKALEPRPSAVERMVRTHHPEAKEKPKARKDSHEAAAARKPKPRMSRAEKHAEKAAALEAARRTKKPAK